MKFYWNTVTFFVHTFSLAAFKLQWVINSCSWDPMAHRPEVHAVWHFTERVYWPLSQQILCIQLYSSKECFEFCFHKQLSLLESNWKLSYLLWLALHMLHQLPFSLFQVCPLHAWYRCTERPKLLWLFSFLGLPWWLKKMAKMVKNLPAIQETQVWSPSREDLLEKGMAAYHGQRTLVG